MNTTIIVMQIVEGITIMTKTTNSSVHFPSPVMKISNPQFFKRIDIVILNPTLRNDARNKRSAKLIPVSFNVRAKRRLICR
mmetsp:Transcript_11395/g.13590  ORF Transcript_11395/g.13590 Transcript_11395/m.13590 type:complete len:81 (+) Transcript_11395:237-479(+)